MSNEVKIAFTCFMLVFDLTFKICIFMRLYMLTY